MAQRAAVDFQFYYEPFERWYRVRAFPTPDGGLAIFSTDITATRRADESLRESEARFRTLSDHAPVLIWLNSPTGCEFVNREYLKFLGLDMHHVQGMNWAEYLHPEDSAEYLGGYLRAIQNRETFTAQFRFRRADGEYRWLRSVGIPRFSSTGDFLGFVGCSVDITDLKVLEESKARLAAIVESSDDAIISKNLRGVITSWNAGAQRIFGYTAQEAIGQPITMLIPPDRFDEEPSILDRIRRGDRIEHYETIRRRKDGTLLDISLSISPIIDDSGNIVGAAKIARDISDRKRIERAIRESREFLRVTLASIGDAVITTDVQGNITYLNAVAQNLTGWSCEEATGCPLGRVFRILNEQTRQPVESPAIRALKEGSVVGLANHSLLVCKDGTERPIDDSAAPIKDEQGTVIGCVLIFRDVTERRDAEKRLYAMMIELREADRRKDEFLATLAHELRGPLAPISNSVELMKRAGGDLAVIEQARDTLERQVAQTVRLVDDLLDVSRISRDKLELRKQHVELRSVIEHALETCGPLIEASRHELSVTLPSEPIWLHADPARLTQVFGNLVNNACKYTPPRGRIMLSARPDGQEVIVSISDTGIGIPPDKLTTVFDMFSQLARPVEMSHGGLGIGLHLVKRLVEMHGGTVQASSEGEGRGSEFVVRLPVMQETTRSQQPFPGKTLVLPGEARRILVVDDNRDSARSLARLLELNGHQTQTAFDGAEAVRRAEAFHPHIVLLDIGLPKLNGYDACREIRRKLSGRKPVMVALTGWGQDEDRQRSQDAGFDAHLVKPIDHATLVKLMSPDGAAGDGAQRR
jgi:PAS domain S-box-containing protein